MSTQPGTHGTTRATTRIMTNTATTQATETKAVRNEPLYDESGHLSLYGTPEERDAQMVEHDRRFAPRTPRLQEDGSYR
jgi:outer membrane receptor for ferrienterochelin and colicin